MIERSDRPPGRAAPGHTESPGPRRRPARQPICPAGGRRTVARHPRRPPSHEKTSLPLRGKTVTDTTGVIADLTAEAEEVDALVAGLAEHGWDMPTPAPGWRVRHQIGHLAFIFRI